VEDDKQRTAIAAAQNKTEPAEKCFQLELRRALELTPVGPGIYIAVHVIQRILTPRLLNKMASYDAAINFSAWPVARHVDTHLNPRLLS
jgi:hypothetical protein